MKTKVKVNLANLSIYELPEGALELIDLISSYVEDAPEQYRSSVQIEFSDYDDNNTEMEMYYYRPETVEEIAARKAKELHYKNKEEQKELQLLAKLKAKYEQQV